jgi:hypothetical protein
MNKNNAPGGDSTPRSTSRTDRRVRSDLATELASRFEKTADLSAYLIDTLGWTWPQAHRALRDAGYYSAALVDERGRIRRLGS